MGLIHHMLFHRRRRRKPRTTTPVAFAVWLVLCISGVVWLGVESQSAEVVIGAIAAVIFVSVKILLQNAKINS